MINIATICSGIGSPEKALSNLGIPYDVAYWCEFDKYASKSYVAIHSADETKNLGDLTKVDISKLPHDLDLLVGGTPCQDFSVAGKRQGGQVDSGTRSSLMWNFVEIIRETKPKVVLWENVPGCLSQGKMQSNYHKFYNRLLGIGYTVNSQILNAKDFGIPQNRSRVFLVAKRRDLGSIFEMPKGYDCGIRLKDVLQDSVDEKYYLTDKNIAHYNRDFGSKGKTQCINGFYETLQSAMGTGGGNIPILKNELIELTQNKTLVVGSLSGGKWDKMHDIGRRVYSPQGISPTIHTMGGGNLEPKVITACAMRGRNPSNPSSRVAGEHTEQRIEVGSEIANTITTVGKDSMVLEQPQYRIRKLTTIECFRLMGFTDADISKCESVGVSNSQLYKQAGNSIVVNVLMAIFGQLYGVDWQPLVYGKWWKPPNERINDLPLFQATKGETK